jgi:hypothetical protein
MSHEATSWALEQPVGGTKKIVLIGIGSHADRHGRNAWPSVDTLALYANVDPRSVQRAIAELVAEGYVIREVGAGGLRNMRDSSRPNLYHLNLDRPNPRFDRNPGEVVHRGDASVTPGGDASVIGGGDASVTGGVTPVSPPGGDASVTLTTIEPSGLTTPLPPKGGAPGFYAVFAEYPRQTAKAKALRMWQAIDPDAATQQAMLQSIRAWRLDPSWQREQGRFVPQLWKWLRERRWEDVPGIAPAPAVCTEPRAPQAPSVPPPPAVRAQLQAILAAAGRTRKAEV